MNYGLLLGRKLKNAGYGLPCAVALVRWSPLLSGIEVKKPVVVCGIKFQVIIKTVTLTVIYGMLMLRCSPGKLTPVLEKKQD